MGHAYTKAKLHIVQRLHQKFNEFITNTRGALEGDATRLCKRISLCSSQNKHRIHREGVKQ